MLKKCLTKYKKITALYLLNGWVQIAASMLTIIFFQKLIDSIGTANRGDSINLLIVYGVLQLLDYILSYVDNYPESLLKNGLYYGLKAAAIKKISTIDYLKYKSYGTGELLQLVENGADAGRNILTHFHLRILREILPNIIISMAFIAIYDYKILLAVLISYGFVFLITKVLLKKLYSVKSTTLINDEILTSRFVRAVMELTVFRINRRYKSEMERYESKSSATVKSKTRILMTHELFFTSFAVIVAVIKITAIFIGIAGVLSGASSMGTIVALVALIDRVYGPIAIFNVEYVDYKLNKIAFKRFEDFINQPDDLKLTEGKAIRFEKGCVFFENVSFAYGGATVLDRFTARFESGKTYAVVGQSGAGKSTLLNLLSGLIKADGGRITVDAQDFSEISLLGYYEHIAYLCQTPAVFDGTVRENMAFDLDVCDEVLWDALEKVNLDKRIKLMEKGLDGEIGEKGSVLSGGEKQRLALARVIIMQPRIVILDEPTSAVDNINESIVMENVFGELKHSMIVAVTHRVRTTHIFDEVILLENGRIEASGKAEELLKANGLFKKLYHNENEKK